MLSEYLSKIKFFFRTWYLEHEPYFWIVVILLINLSISWIVRESNIFFVPNTNPIGYNFGYIGSIGIILFVSFISFQYKIINFSPVNVVFIMAGVYSNFAEKLIWNSVADYMSIGFAYINLADLQIFMGLFLLNISVWLVKKPEEKKMKKSSLIS